MSLSSSTSSNTSGSSLHHSLLATCFGSIFENLIFVAYTFASILLVLPLAVAVLHVGVRRCASGSHGDVIAYHQVAMEAIGVLGSVSYCVGVYAGWRRLIVAACYAVYIPLCAQMLFHVLACVERYVAVVHPVAYLRRRHGGGPRLRNALVWSVWLFSVAKTSLAASGSIDSIVALYLAQLALTMVVVPFCSLSVLRVLRRPAPGEGRERAGPSKQRTFDTIAAIMASLLLRFLGSLVCTSLYLLLDLSAADLCAAIQTSYWFCLPSSLVSPLLFLHRAGKLRCRC